MFGISIKEDGELKDIKDCRRDTIWRWMMSKEQVYLMDLIMSLIRELRRLRDEKLKSQQK